MTRTLPRVALAVAEIILFMIVVTLISAGNARSQGAVAPPETRHMPTSVGPYILARSVQKTSGLTELSPMEYSAFRSGNDPTIPQETIFKAAPVRFERAFLKLPARGGKTMFQSSPVHILPD